MPVCILYLMPAAYARYLFTISKAVMMVNLFQQNESKKKRVLVFPVHTNNPNIFIHYS